MRKKIEKTLVQLYKEFYPIKNLFKESLFPYSIDEIESAFVDTPELVKPSKKKPIDSKIESIKTKEDLRWFYETCLKYNKKDSKQNKDVENSLSKQELLYLHSIIFSNPPSSNSRKTDIIKDISEYYQSIERAKSLK